MYNRATGLALIVATHVMNSYMNYIMHENMNFWGNMHF